MIAIALAFVPLEAPPTAHAALMPPGRMAASPDLRPAALEVPIGSVAFAPQSAVLPSTAGRLLDSVAARLAADRSMRVELQAFAGGSDVEARAHRLSLQRALALRDYLMSRGIPRLRIIVRAFGNHSAGGNEDRVDVVPLNQ